MGKPVEDVRPRLDPVDLQRRKVLKTITSTVRLEHALAADEELNSLLPKAEKVFNDAEARGCVLTPAEVKKKLGL